MTSPPSNSFFRRLGSLVARHWLSVILGWLVVVILTQWLAPRWDDVTRDGDLAYMPGKMTSVRAEALLEQAFPGRRSKSEMVIVISRDSGPLSLLDLRAADRLAARLHNLVAMSRLRELDKAQRPADGSRIDTRLSSRTDEQTEDLQRQAQAALDESLRLDEKLSSALNNRAILARLMGNEEAANVDAQLALDYEPALRGVREQLLPARVESLPLLDVWTRHTDVVGSKLLSRDRHAELIVVRLSQEFMATDNIRVLEQLESEVAAVQRQTDFPAGLQLGITGSAAVGGDMLRSSAESIRNTELYSVILVVLILAVVYRAPLLVAVPLITIVASVSVATGWVAALTQLDRVPGFEWWNFQIFTTTKIFVVVILFGAGTDFCLFLISRYQEELDRGTDRSQGVERALYGVGDALTASAFTTIVGLGMMFFADFGKFRNSGPAIGLCLFVTLVACLTLAPALLRAFGPWVFWPFQARRSWDSSNSPVVRFWEWLARVIVAYPGRVLVLCVGVMAPLSIMGTNVEVTYDFLSELAPSRPSRVATSQLQRYFPVGETSPIVVLARVPGGDLDTPTGKAALNQLTKDLYLEGVTSVRSLAAPRGDRPNGFSLKKAALQSHELTRSLYLGKSADGSGDVARLEVLLEHDPFSLSAIEVLNQISYRLEHLQPVSAGYWQHAEFLFAGTTAAIRDLRAVTHGDNLRIQVLVVLAVLAVLLVILQRPVVCFYLILSVLFSYYVTMGATETFFRWAYGETFHGLDWKVPLFLFVILVAIGQDYNIYLATRVFEEQQTHGLFGGLRRAIVRTGGIITSCGVIMAGTFVSMTSGSLRGIVELGFALSLGVLLDTLVVRTVLVPAFLALLFRSFSAAPALRAAIRPSALPLAKERRTP